MNFIEETNFAARDLEAWNKGHGFSDRDKLQRLAQIWDEFKNIPERKKMIYPNQNSTAPKTDLSCGSCVQDLLRFCFNWRKITENEVTKEYKFIPQAEVEVKGATGKGLEIDIETKVGTIEIDIDPKDEQDALDPNAKFPRLKQIASRLHVKFTPKDGKEILKELIKKKIEEIKANREKR